MADAKAAANPQAKAAAKEPKAARVSIVFDVVQPEAHSSFMNTTEDLVKKLLLQTIAETFQTHLRPVGLVKNGWQEVCVRRAAVAGTGTAPAKALAKALAKRVAASLVANLVAAARAMPSPRFS